MANHDDPSGSGGDDVQRTTLNPSEGGLAFLGENILVLMTILVPTLMMWIMFARVFQFMPWLFYLLGFVWLVTSSTFLFARYEYMSNWPFVKMIVRFYTQPKEMVYDRFPDESGIEQPERENIAARISRMRGFRQIPVFGAKADEDNRTFRPQDLVPLKRPFRDSPAIESERKDRRSGRGGDVTTVIGAIRIEPPNIVTKDREAWKNSAREFAASLDSTFKGNSQLYEPMRSANYEPRVYQYRFREQQLRQQDRFDPQNGGVEDTTLALADYTQERGDNVSLRDITALVRDYYVVHEVTPIDVVDVDDVAGGGLGAVPILGYIYKEIKIWQLQKSDEYVDEMAVELEDRLKKMSDALEQITDLRCSVVPSEHFSQAVADHYNAANMYANAEFRDVIRQSPRPNAVSREQRLEDLLDYVPEGFQNPEGYEDDLSPEMRRVLGVDSGTNTTPDDISPGIGGSNQTRNGSGNGRTTAVRTADGTRLDPGAEGMAEYGVAWDHIKQHPLSRTGVIRNDPLEDGMADLAKGDLAPSTGTQQQAVETDGSGAVEAADGTGESGGKDLPDRESMVDALVNENGGPVDFDVVSDYEDEYFIEWYRSALCSEDNIGREDPNYLVIDDQEFAATMMITNWPPDVEPGFLEPILRFEDPAVSVTMSTHIHEIDQNKLEMELADKENEQATRVEKVASSRLPVFLERFRQEHEATEEMLQSVTRSSHDTFDTQTYLEVRAHTPRSLYKAVDRIKNRLRSEGAAATLLKHNHEKGHQTVAPICDDQINHSIKMRSDGLGCLNPWTVRNLYDDTGIEIGENMAANEPLAYDFWKRTVAPHFGMWTESGGGKTTLATLMFLRLHALDKDHFLALIDPMEEFVNFAELFPDAERIVVGGDKGMNPLHGSPTPEEKLAAIGHETPYSEWKEGGVDFLSLYYGALGWAFTSAKQTIWTKAIEIVGKKHGITSDPRTLDPEYRAERQQAYLEDMAESVEQGPDYANVEQCIARKTDGARCTRNAKDDGFCYQHDESCETVDLEDEMGVPEDYPDDVANPDVDPRSWPTLLDCVDVIEEMSDDAADERFVSNPNNDRQVEDREEVATVIINNDVEPLRPGNQYDHFGKENEIHIENESGLVYVDLQLKEGDVSAGLEMHVILDRLYKHCKEIRTKAGIFCDEFHYMLRDNQVMKSLNHKFRHGRHWDLWIGVASQSYRDLFGTDQDGKQHLTDNAEVMFENMSAQFYLHNDMGYEQWGRKLGLTREETAFINDANVGEVLLRVQNTGTYPLNITLDIKENPRETVIAEYKPDKHGENFLAYLEQHRDICEWSFAPVDITDAPDAEIDVRDDMADDEHDPYAYGPSAVQTDGGIDGTGQGSGGN